MIFADGAGATLLEATDQKGVGILAHSTRTDACDKAWMLRLDKSYGPERPGDELLVKMDGHDIYKYALRTVPQMVKRVLDKAGLAIGAVSKILVHQANAKMDDAILKRLFKLCKVDSIPDGIMPMTIHWAGNSSVATIPTLLDLLVRGQLDGHDLGSGDVVVFASVGAGMNINAMAYRVP
jgi:3-oxoacyl-[acyl-carrier-protein] synthase-3